MKKVSILMVILLMAGNLVMAQNGPRGDRNMTPKERAERMTEEMVKDYSLDAEQKEKVAKLNLDMTEKSAKLRDESDRDKRRTEMEKIRKDYNEKLKKIMTTEQYESYTKKQEERRQRMRNNR